jgi:hypothetical protein
MGCAFHRHVWRLMQTLADILDFHVAWRTPMTAIRIITIYINNHNIAFIIISEIVLS